MSSFLNKTLLPSHTAEILFTQNCNLNCTYCFEKVKNTSCDMNTEDLYQKMTNNGTFYTIPFLRFYMFGGEPLANQPFLEDLILRIEEDPDMVPDQKREYLSSICGSLTTNGTLIKKYIDFLKKYNFSFQISLDGPEDINDLCRVDKAGNGHFKEIMENIQLCKETGLSYSLHGALDVSNYKHFARINKWFAEQTIDSYKEENRIENIFNHNYLQIIFEGNINDPDIDILLEQFKETVEWILYGDFFKEYSMDTRKKIAAGFLKRSGGVCGSGHSLFVYDNDFNVYGCHRFRTKPSYTETYFFDKKTERINYKLYEQLTDLATKKILFGPYWNVDKTNKDNINYQANWCPATNYDYSKNVYYMPPKHDVLLAELQRFIPSIALFYDIPL